MLFSSNRNKISKTAEELKEITGNKDIYYTVGDITKDKDIHYLVDHTASKFGSIDILVNNTCGPAAGEFDVLNDEDWQKAYELVLVSAIRAIRAVVPHMKKQGGGHIVNSTSSSVKRVIDNLILSNTFRMGVVGLTKTLSQE